VEAVHFNLPFGCGCCNFNCNFKFTQMSGVKFKIFDVTKGKLLEEYLGVLKEGKHGRGTGYNPCRACKIWMFRKAKEYADELGVKVIATGEVLGQRPFSQTSLAMKLIDKAIGFKLERPLIDLGFEGRRREKQMALADKFKMTYPTPGGGCLLCEKALKERFKFLLEKNLIDEKTLMLVQIGRHFVIDGFWFVVARDAKESLIIDEEKNSIQSGLGKPAVYFNNIAGEKNALKLQEAFSTGSENRKDFAKFKL